jgi:hypothetical protein
MNDRQVDLKMIGKRHAMIGKYRVCIDRRDAKIVAMDLVLNGDAGASKSVSGPVLELAALVSDNAYGIRNFMCRATPYLTNKPTGTAFRSFGVVQTVQLTETAIQHAWDAVHQCGLSGISAPAFRRKHFSNQMPNDKNPCAPLRYNKYSGWTGYGQELRQYKNMGKIWNNIMEKYEEVEEQGVELDVRKRHRHLLDLRRLVVRQRTERQLVPHLLEHRRRRAPAAGARARRDRAGDTVRGVADGARRLT